MASSEIERAWYSESRVKEIQLQNLSSWRSRYDLKEKLLLNDYSLVIRNLRRNDMVPVSTSEDALHIVTPGENHRPDVVAFNFYKEPRLAWVILAANELSDIFDFNTGMEIIVPSLTSLYQNGGILNR